MSRDLEKIGATAHYTAHVWRRLGLPYSRLFATTRGAALFFTFRLAGEWIAAVTPGVPSMPQYLAQRHLAIEHALEQLRPDLVIELGAGLSRRGITWAVDRGVRYIEVDFPYMVEAKRALIPPDLRARAGDRLRHESHDILAPEFADTLRRLLGSAERPAVIAEGVMGYFHPPQREQLARHLAASMRNGMFLCDLRTKSGGRALGVRFLRAAIKIATAGRGASEDFEGEAEIRAWFRAAGFRDAEPIDLREVAGAPRVPSPARVWRATTA